MYSRVLLAGTLRLVEPLLTFYCAKSICLNGWSHTWQFHYWSTLWLQTVAFTANKSFLRWAEPVGEQNLCVRRRHQRQQDGGGAGGRVEDGLPHPGRAHQAGGGHRRVLRVQGNVSDFSKYLGMAQPVRCQVHLYFGATALVRGTCCAASQALKIQSLHPVREGTKNMIPTCVCF